MAGVPGSTRIVFTSRAKSACPTRRTAYTTGLLPGAVSSMDLDCTACRHQVRQDVGFRVAPCCMAMTASHRGESWNVCVLMPSSACCQRELLPAAVTLLLAVPTCCCSVWGAKKNVCVHRYTELVTRPAGVCRLVCYATRHVQASIWRYCDLGADHKWQVPTMSSSIRQRCASVMSQ